MSKCRLFNFQCSAAAKIAGSADGLVNPLWAIFKQKLDTLLGVRCSAVGPCGCGLNAIACLSPGGTVNER